MGPWMPWCHSDYGRHDVEGWIQAAIDRRESDTMYEFAVIADGEYAGGCGINCIDWVDRVANPFLISGIGA